MTENTSMVLSHDHTDIASSVMLILVMPLATYKLRPTGGWHVQISMLTVMMIMPNMPTVMPEDALIFEHLQAV